MADVFVSYKSDERGRAGFVAGLLEAAGFSVWWDAQLRSGETYDRVITREIDSAKCLIALWSEASVSSDWVRSEALLADDQGKLVPIWMENVRIPPPFNLRHTIDLRHWRGSPEDPNWLDVISAARRLVDPSGLSKVGVEAYSRSVIARSGHLIHKLKAKDSTGRWACYFVLVMPDKEGIFLRAIEGNGMIGLEDYGFVIASCYGEVPNAEVKQFLKARYDFDV